MNFLGTNSMMRADSLLQYGASVCVSHLSKNYEMSTIIKDMSFSVAAGESLAIIGPSGCGKSTLLYLLSGLDTQHEGTISYMAQEHVSSHNTFLNKHSLLKNSTLDNNTFIADITNYDEKQSSKDSLCAQFSPFRRGNIDSSGTNGDNGTDSNIGDIGGSGASGEHNEYKKHGDRYNRTQCTKPTPQEYHSFLEVYGRKPRMSFVMQDYGLFPWKNAEENLALPLILVDMPLSIQKNAIKEMLYELGLEGINQKYPNELSGGQRQRLALGRALISSPEILLLDEPLSSVDAITREHLQKLLLQLWKKHAFTCILVTHSVSEAIYLGKNIMVMGKKKEGEPESSQFISMLDNPCFGDENRKNTDAYTKMNQFVSQALAQSYEKCY